jgi:hypothetical protein
MKNAQRKREAAAAHNAKYSMPIVGQQLPDGANRNLILRRLGISAELAASDRYPTIIAAHARAVEQKRALRGGPESTRTIDRRTARSLGHSIDYGLALQAHFDNENLKRITALARKRAGLPA